MQTQIGINVQHTTCVQQRETSAGSVYYYWRATAGAILLALNCWRSAERCTQLISLVLCTDRMHYYIVLLCRQLVTVTSAAVVAPAAAVVAVAAAMFEQHEAVAIAASSTTIILVAAVVTVAAALQAQQQLGNAVLKD
jgi:hypothetical protein